jgi:hypothetical protein
VHACGPGPVHPPRTDLMYPPLRGVARLPCPLGCHLCVVGTVVLISTHWRPGTRIKPGALVFVGGLVRQLLPSYSRTCECHCTAVHGPRMTLLPLLWDGWYGGTCGAPGTAGLVGGTCVPLWAGSSGHEGQVRGTWSTPAPPASALRLNPRSHPSSGFSPPWPLPCLVHFLGQVSRRPPPDCSPSHIQCWTWVTFLKMG